jgi:hypothetical protein
MKLPIGAIAGVAAMAARSLGPVQALLVARPPSPGAAVGRTKAQPREATLLKIEINLNR